jgi:hypothetical protein
MELTTEHFAATPAIIEASTLTMRDRLTTTELDTLMTMEQFTTTLTKDNMTLEEMKAVVEQASLLVSMTAVGQLLTGMG